MRRSDNDQPTPPATATTAPTWPAGRSPASSPAADSPAGPRLEPVTTRGRSSRTALSAGRGGLCPISESADEITDTSPVKEQSLGWQTLLLAGLPDRLRHSGQQRRGRPRPAEPVPGWGLRVEALTGGAVPESDAVRIRALRGRAPAVRQQGCPPLRTRSSCRRRRSRRWSRPRCRRATSAPRRCWEAGREPDGTHARPPCPEALSVAITCARGAGDVHAQHSDAQSRLGLKTSLARHSCPNEGAEPLDRYRRRSLTDWLSDERRLVLRAGGLASLRPSVCKEQRPENRRGAVAPLLRHCLQLTPALLRTCEEIAGNDIGAPPGRTPAAAIALRGLCR